MWALIDMFGAIIKSGEIKIEKGSNLHYIPFISKLVCQFWPHSQNISNLIL